MSIKNNMSDIGFFDDLENEFIINNPEQKRLQENFLFNERVFSYVQQTGRGYSKYMDNNDYATTLLNNTDLNRIVYIRDNDTKEFWSVGWEPICMEYEKYECRIGLNYNIITNVTKGIECSWSILVPHGDAPVEMWNIKISSKEKRNLSLFMYAEISLSSSYPTYGEGLFSNAKYNENFHGIIAVNNATILQDKMNTVTGIPTRKPDSYTCSKNDFLGVYRTLSNPLSLQKETLPNTLASSEALCIAYQFNLTTDIGKVFEVGNIFIAHNYKEDISQYKNMSASFNVLLIETKEKLLETLKQTWITTGDEDIDRITNFGTKRMVSLGITHNRWGLKGYRDVIQHGLGSLYFDPENTKKNLIKGFKYQYANGFSVRSFPLIHEDSFMQYNDSSTWLIYTVTEYLKETGDFKFLNEKIPFIDKGEATVLERLDLIIDSVYSDRGQYGLIKMRGGDWNDSFTNVGKKGIGESVWLSMFFGKAILLVDELKTYLGKPDKKYMEMYESLKEAVNTHGWDGEWYLRAYNDAGEKIGSKESKQAKIFLNPQSWALISGMADEKKTKLILKSIDKYLYTDYGYMLNYPEYANFDENIGRLTTLEPGTCENGSIYIHGNAFLLNGLLAIGEADRALNVLKIINPVNHASNGLLVCPYIYPNSYFGPSHKKTPFKMEFTWITGSINWLLLGIIEHMFGIRRTYDGIKVNPVLPAELKYVKLSRKFRGSSYNFSIQNKGRSISSIKINDVKLEKGTTTININTGTTENNVEIELI